MRLVIIRCGPCDGVGYTKKFNVFSGAHIGWDVCARCRGVGSVRVDPERVPVYVPETSA